MPDVLVVVKGLGLGGAERLVAEGVLDATRRGSRYRYQVAYVLPWKDQLVDQMASSGIEVICIGGPRGSLARAARSIRSLNQSVNLIHAHLPATGIISRMASRAPVVYTEHNLADSYRQPTRWLNRITYGRNDAVTAVSESVAKSITGFPGPPPVTIRNGVAVGDVDDARSSVRSEFDVDPETPLVVHVGNIRPHKGHDNLIRTIAELRKRGTRVRVLSAGTEKHPGDLERLRSAATEAEVNDFVDFLGRRDDAHRLIAAADVLVNPSDVEGLPVVILEAMRLDTPVVATDVGGVSSVVRNGDTGWLAPPADPSALADAVEEALDKPELTAEVVERARKLVDAEYGIGRMVDEFEALYDRVLA